LVVFNPFFFGSQVFDNGFSLFRVVPEVWSESFFFFVGYFYELGIDVKDTSSAHQDAL
jgi:hypothetical protein